jgi:hypothetical protein
MLKTLIIVAALSVAGFTASKCDVDVTSPTGLTPNYTVIR